MANWFSTYQRGDWTPEKGYNEYFGQIILMLRQWFFLKKQSPGRDISQSGQWLQYDIRGDTVYIIVDVMEYAGYRRYAGYVTPQIRFKVRMARKVWKPGVQKGFLARFFNTASQSSGEVRLEQFFDEVLIMEFETDPRAKPPMFKIDNPSLQFGVSHRYHQLSGGWLCIIAGYNDWNRTDTVVSGIGSAFDWIVWYYKTFEGW